MKPDKLNRPGDLFVNYDTVCMVLAIVSSGPHTHTMQDVYVLWSNQITWRGQWLHGDSKVVMSYRSERWQEG